jgi:Family of unknown function (DUF5675)
VNVIIERFAYTPTETEGRLLIAGQVLNTLERPWIQGEDLGGLGFKSCIPDGVYELRPYVRNKNGDHVFCYVNEALGVYFAKADRPAGVGRFKCLWHPANYVHQVVGCTAIGNRRQIYNGKRMVSNSRKTFDVLRGLMNFDESHKVEIRPALGAFD